MAQYLPLKPYNWPQDEVAIPRGIGSMPPIEYANRILSRSEYATFTATFAAPALQAAGTTAGTIINTDQDGDFWCDQIAIVTWQTSAGTTQLRLPSFEFAVQDMRTNRKLFYPGRVPAAMFRKFPLVTPTSVYSGQEPSPAQFRTTGTLIQPFCFTRQGGIIIDITYPNAVPAATSYQIDIMFSGWKEYANASR